MASADTIIPAIMLSLNAPRITAKIPTTHTRDNNKYNNNKSNNINYLTS